MLFNNTEPEGYKRHFNIVKKIVLQIPESKEQTKIANFLTSVDTKIEQIGKQLESTAIQKSPASTNVCIIKINDNSNQKNN